jgi:hypothetical protein
MSDLGLGCVRTLMGPQGRGQGACSVTVRLQPQARIAAISGFTPRMFNTRVKL